MLLEQPQLWSAGLPLASLLGPLAEMMMTALFGVLAGSLLVGVLALIQRLRHCLRQPS